jgi:hypothetical protein
MTWIRPTPGSARIRAAGQQAAPRQRTLDRARDGSGCHWDTPTGINPASQHPATGQLGMEQQHLPERPSWQCGHCGQARPCSPARVQLGEQYVHDLVGLAVHMELLRGQAVREIGGVSPQELNERFVAWTRVRRNR